MKKEIIITSILFLVTNQIFATTWDEPWRKEIIQKAEYFVFGKVINSTDSIITIQIQKDFGSSIQGEIKIDDFYLLDLCSRSAGHGPEFHFEEDEEGYFFLKKGKNGNYQLPTPTSGVDRIVEDKVYSIYRHSYHQAALKRETYEITYNAIWNYYKQKDFDEKEIFKFIYDSVKKEPAGFEENEIETFFEQHAALESAYLLGIDLDFKILKKFIESDNFHLQVSGLRALGIVSSKKTREYLLNYIKNPESQNFNKVIAIWSLWESGSKRDKRKIWKLRKKVSDEEEGFGGNIMDSRVCTYFPSPKRAIIDLKKKK
jgi:hypothetical protein